MRRSPPRADAQKPVVIVLHGPSGAGKDSVIATLQERLPILRPVSSTSRLPRKGEVDGVDYHFLTRDEFLRKAEEGEFIEFAEVYGDLKGLEAREIEAPLEDGRDVIIRTDVQGARAWREKLAGGVFIFLMAEDREALRARLISRGSEDGDSMARRLAELDEELADVANNDHVVINHRGGLDRAVDEIVAIIDRERARKRRRRPRLIRPPRSR